MISHESQLPRCLSDVFHVRGGFLQEYINLKDFERPFLEILHKLYLIIYARCLSEINTLVHQTKLTQT